MYIYTRIIQIDKIKKNMNGKLSTGVFYRLCVYMTDFDLKNQHTTYMLSRTNILFLSFICIINVMLRT